MAVITIDELTKTYNDTCVLRSITLEIKNGEFFVVVGPSGSGKSTLLRLIAGLIKPTSGNIKFDGEPVTSLDARERNVAMVFQNYALYPHKRVYDNIAFGLRARKVPESEVDQRVHSAARLLGIESLLRRWPKELSGGERQRVAIGRAIIREPAVYLLDEPLSNLDAKLRIEMRNELTKLHKRLKTSFIYVTHDQVEAMTLGQRIAVINREKIEQVGTPEELYDFPVNQFVAGFIGSPPMNFIKGTFYYDGKSRKVTVDVPSGTIDLEGQLESRLPISNGYEVVMGIRPEAINLKKSGESAMSGRVHRVEPIGHEGFIYLEMMGSPLTARVKNWQEYRGVRKLALSIHIDNIYLFLLENDRRCILAKGRIV